jgi:dienelactone hydrolase
MTYRYISLLMALAMASPVAAGELLENGNFADKLDGWRWITQPEYKGKMDAPDWRRGRGKEPASISVKTPWASTNYYAQLRTDIEVESEAVYRLTFQIKGNVSEGDFQLIAGQYQNKKFKNIGLYQKIPVTGEWTPVSILMKTKALVGDETPSLLLCFGASKGTTELRSLSLIGPLKDAAPKQPHGDVESEWTEPEFSKVDGYHVQRKAVMQLAGLTEAPTLLGEDGAETTIEAGGLKKVYFEALEYEGKPTRVFAWLGMPKGASAANKVPGIVLVHGGGGTAFKDWVQKWTAHGYAAISIGVEGQIDVRSTAEEKKKGTHWKPHSHAGPGRVGIYHDSNKPFKAQWMYHAVAQTILANSLMRALEQVDAEKVGLMGISWGGVITSTVIGIDQRFAFAIPTYGCGNLADAENQYGKALGHNHLYRQLWDPILRMDKASMPVMWFSWPLDSHFPLDSQAACYRKAPGKRMVTLLPGMRHGHSPAWNPPHSYAFADSVVNDGAPWAEQTGMKTDGTRVAVRFSSTKVFDKAILVWTADTGITGKRKWTETPVQLKKTGDNWVVSATLPTGTTGWFVNAVAGNLIVSSDYTEK